MRFRDLPIRRKLMLAIVLTSAVALLLGGGAMIFFEFVRSRHLLVRELSTETEIIAANSAAAVAFQDRGAAREILAALRNHPAIVHACLFTPDGKLFVEYKSANTNKDFPALAPETSGYRFEERYVLLFRPVQLGEDVVGNIALRADLREETARLKASVSIAVVALLTALFVSLLLSIRFQKVISKPVLELANVAHAVMERKDYALRANKQSDDEIGQLIGAFNQMLVQIEKRDVDLGASEERFRQLAENINEVFWITDPIKKIIYISPAYETIWGRPCESIHHSPRSWTEAIHADDRERVLCAAITKQEKGEYDETYRILRPDGSLRWIHDRAFPVRDKDEKIYRIAGIAEDITKRKQAEQAHQLAEAKYRNIFENAIEGIFQTTPDGHFLAANPALARMLGYASPEELMASVTNLGEQLSVDPEAQRELSRQLEKHSEARDVEYQLCLKDGSRIWVSVNVRVQRDNEGKALYYEGTSYEITERKRAEETLRRTEELYRQAITRTGAVPYACDYKTRDYLFIGDGIEQLIGYAPHEMRGGIWKNIAQEAVMLGEAAGLTLEEAGRRIATGQIKNWRCDMQVLTRNGQLRWISDVSVQSLDEIGQFVGSMGILQDITDRKQAEQKSAIFSSLASRLSAATTPQEAAWCIMDTANDLFGWDCGFLHLYDPKNDRTVPILTFDIINGERIAVSPQDFEHSPSPLTRLVMEKGGFLLDQQDRASLPFNLIQFGDKKRSSASRMYVPLRQGATVIGILSIQRYTPNSYHKDDLNLLQAMADHCGGALQRIKATEELLEAEAKYRGIFENATEGIFQTTPDGRFLAANPAAARMLGYESPEELIASITNLGAQLCVDPETRAELSRQLEINGEVREFEHQLYRKDGSRIWVSVNVRAVRDDQEKALYYEGTAYEITERKRAEETLRRTEQIYRQAITGAGAVPYICDYKTKSYLFIGEGIERLTGYAPHELRPNFWKQLEQESVMMGEMAGLTLQEAIKRVASGEVRTWRCDMRIMTRDGQSRWISDSSVQTLDESGQLIGSMGILQDITERKQAEKKGASFSSLSSQLSSAATPEEAAGSILETAAELIGWDCGFVRLYDRERDRIVPILTYDLVEGKRTVIPSSDLQGPSPIMRLILEKGALLIDQQSRASLPFKFVPFGNENRSSTSMMYVPIRQSNNVIGVLSIQRYTSNIYSQEDLKLLQSLADHCGGALQRIQITEQLREAEAKYRSIFEDATEGIFQTTPEGRYLSANPALAHMFGYDSPEEMIASITDIERQTYVLPEKRKELRRLSELPASAYAFEVERYRKDGSKFWISINSRAVRDANGTVSYYEGTVRDVTLRRHLEKQLIEISDREQSRMGQDLHDGLCQHLVLTAFAANLLQKDLANQSSAPVEQAKKVSQLVDDAITQARNLARGLYPVKIETEGLHSALQELAANIRSAYNLDCDFESSDSISITDHALATHLYRIAQEGAINAAKHAKPKQIQIRLNRIGNKIHLTVSDNGTGIPAATARAGSMGLHIMNYRAGMIGAALKVEPQPGGGTIVSCIFEYRNGIEKQPTN